MLKDLNASELWTKFERFKLKRELERDPLVRYCTKPGCDGHMRGKSNGETQKLQCPKCSTWVCFLCREEWHGEGLSCEALLDKQLEGWVKNNNRKVSFCPMCRTRIEKNKGCNHMTCAFCKYQFCWACSASATYDDHHFETGRGCGVGLMEQGIKPNSL